MITTRVSIITPAYNAAQVVNEAIRSVQAQTYEDWEMLVADDCSRDNTRTVVAEAANADPRLRLLPLAENGGPARARQAALNAAAGRYVAFLDSDDYWLPEKLERQLDFMSRQQAAFSFTGFRRISTDGVRVGKLVIVPQCLTHKALLGNTAIATSTVILDRSLTGPFAMTETFYDDFALWLEITRRGHIAHGLREDLMRYRVAANSWSRNKARSALWVWRTYRDIERLGIVPAAWAFANYACHAFLKYRSF